MRSSTMSDLPDQKVRLTEVDWDILVVLDACRWDYWEHEVGDGEPVQSPGNNTNEWIRQVAPFLWNEPTMCITANPEVTRWTHDDLWAERDNVWQRGWENINGVGTVAPETVTRSVRTNWMVGPDRRIYAHYAQPHGPYPKVDPAIPVMRNNPEAAEVQTDVDYHPDTIIMDPTALLDDEDSWLSVEQLRTAYRENLRWAWDSVQELFELDATLVVTADHGEILGERAPAGDRHIRYGHPSGSPLEILRKVPFAVYD